MGFSELIAFALGALVYALGTYAGWRMKAGLSPLNSDAFRKLYDKVMTHPKTPTPEQVPEKPYRAEP